MAKSKKVNLYVALADVFMDSVYSRPGDIREFYEGDDPGPHWKLLKKDVGSSENEKLDDSSAELKELVGSLGYADKVCETVYKEAGAKSVTEKIAALKKFSKESEADSGKA